jgi:ribonuclease T1
LIKLIFSLKAITFLAGKSNRLFLHCGPCSMMSSMKKYRQAALLILSIEVLLLAAILMLAACGRGPEPSSRRTIDVPRVASGAPQARESIKAGEIDAANFPEEAHHTLQLIKKGGPFPYAKDGAVFGNREGMLPAEPRGYYHEYTVKTPGERDRGARRIIVGRKGEYYYTDDHYRSFRRIRE